MNIEPVVLPATIRIGEGVEVEIEINVFAYKGEDGELVVRGITLYPSGSELEFSQEELDSLSDELSDLF